MTAFLITKKRDPESDPPMLGKLMLAEWEPGRPVPAYRSLDDGWVAVGSHGVVDEGRCEPLTWAELPRLMTAADGLAAAGIDPDDLREVLDAAYSRAASLRESFGARADRFTDVLDIEEAAQRVEAALQKEEA